MNAKLDSKITFEQLKKLTPVTLNVLERDPVTPPEEFEDRLGYRTDFLEGWSIPFPQLTGIHQNDMLKLHNSDDVILNYNHFLHYHVEI